MNELEKMDLKINKHKAKLYKLYDKRQQICKHHHTKRGYYIDGDTCWPNTGYRVDFIECLDCGKRWEK